MGWLSRIFKGSNHEVSHGEYNWRYEDNTAANGNHPSTSWVNIALYFGILITVFKLIFLKFDLLKYDLTLLLG